MSDTPSQAAEGTVSRDSKDGGLGGGVDTVASQHVVGMEEGGGSTGAVPQRTRRRHQRSQRASRDAAAAAAVGDGLESLPGVNMLLQAAWAVLLDAQQGNARLASALAANWAPASGNWPFTTGAHTHTHTYAMHVDCLYMDLYGGTHAGASIAMHTMCAAYTTCALHACMCMCVCVSPQGVQTCQTKAARRYPFS